MLLGSHSHSQKTRPYLLSHHKEHDVAISAAYYYIRSTPLAKKLMREILRYLYEHGTYVLELWVLESFVSRSINIHGVNMPYLPAGDLPTLRWVGLDNSLFVCSAVGWNCREQRPDELLFFHIHSRMDGDDKGGRRDDGTLAFTEGTELGNLTKLLSNTKRLREAALWNCCNRKTPPMKGLPANHQRMSRREYTIMPYF